MTPAKKIECLPYLFALIGLACFLGIWIWVYDLPNLNWKSDPFWIAYGLAVATSFLLVKSFHERRLNAWRHHSLFRFGLVSSLLNFVGIVLVFVGASWALAYCATGINQWYAAKYLFLWLFLVGLPIALVIGLVYGFMLNRLDRARD